MWFIPINHLYPLSKVSTGILNTPNPQLFDSYSVLNGAPTSNQVEDALGDILNLEDVKFFSLEW